ncbi:tRNA pseudouridine(55) synthase TruB [Solicola gregarius]|uniref:tRNA pseudouridine synthase B n=1 Tax=Solicola gregarius TaxID=2908642 RepID=A0AA46YL36_9ACTN|nr:tRNA pseudouridine(55) synthase TruB [Solicola gregarius]UYM04483.1 tRNA pseudouridine(55) synthase TruB [Solicola gregarius]
MSDGLVIVDKPPGWTSHDVVGRVRRLAGTRKVGHAGTLDPMATGVLVLGVDRATRLLGHLMLTEKEYAATIRLGASTNTDDAEGEASGGGDATHLGRADVESVLPKLRGTIEQVPSTVSAIKVDGKRAYARARAGEAVELQARTVHINRLEIVDARSAPPYLDVDVAVACSSGTYVRALARDIGSVLGVGAHLTALRRTRVGPFGLDTARTLEGLADDFAVLDIGAAARSAFEVVTLDEESARMVRHGRPLHDTRLPGEAPVAMFGPDGAFLALYEQRGEIAKAVAVFG